MGVGDLTDSPCEQGNTEQIFTKLAFHGNGAEIWMGTWMLVIRDLAFPLTITLCFKHAAHFLKAG